MSVKLSRFIDFSFVGKYRDTWFNWCRIVFYIMIIIFNISNVIKFFNGHSVVEGSNQITGISTENGKHSFGGGKH